VKPWLRPLKAGSVLALGVGLLRDIAENTPLDLAEAALASLRTPRIGLRRWIGQ
jgi:hypothetical protein